MTATTHIIDWKNKSSLSNKPMVTIVTEPDSINVGDVVTIKLYSAYPHELSSPYLGLGAKRVLPDSSNVDLDEIVELSGGSEISCKFPIASVKSIVVGLPIVDETSRAVIDNDRLSQLITVVNHQLKITDSTVKMHGSIRIIYKTFNAQQWIHSAFLQKGRALLFAHNLTTGDYENVALSINEQTRSVNDSIRIDSYPTLKFDMTPYAHFIVYPANRRKFIAADVGSVNFVRNEQQTITAEQITFSGKEANASFYIDSLKSFKGFFFDAKGNVISPAFSVSDGKLVANVECWGSGYINYKTTGSIYEYNAEVSITNIPGGGQHMDVQIGTVYAFDWEKKGISASYKIPNVVFESSEPTDFIEIYKEIVIDRNGAWEKPDDFTGDENTMIQQYVVASGYYYSNGYTDVATYGQENLGVYKNRPFSGVKYKMNKNIPTNANAYVQMAVAQKVADLTFKYGIPNV